MAHSSRHATANILCAAIPGCGIQYQYTISAIAKQSGIHGFHPAVTPLPYSHRLEPIRVRLVSDFKKVREHLGRLWTFLKRCKIKRRPNLEPIRIGCFPFSACWKWWPKKRTRSWLHSSLFSFPSVWGRVEIDSSSCCCVQSPIVWQIYWDPGASICLLHDDVCVA